MRRCCLDRFRLRRQILSARTATRSLPRWKDTPEEAFSPDQWAAIAKAIKLDRIPCNEKREICHAILAYDFDRLNDERANDEKSGQSVRRRVDPRAKGRAAFTNF